MKILNIAIDGPAGAGKSTIAKAVAKKMDLIYLDTGALYRSIGYYVHKSGLSPENAVKEIEIDVFYANYRQEITINGENITDKIRTPEMSMMASNVSKVAVVREFLLDVQRDTAKKNSVIMDGRDIGTVILPNADVKIFLTASAEKRAKRRFDETEENITFEEILADVIARDNQDSTREIAPLKPADDAIIVDTTELDLEQSIAKILEIISMKTGEK